MDLQRTGRIFGWFFIGTFVTSIPARLLFVNGLGASWSDVRFVPGATSDDEPARWARCFEFGLIVTQIATAVVIYPLVQAAEPNSLAGYVSRSHHGVGIRRDRHHEHDLGRERG